MRWRMWLTRRFLERWLSQKVYYRLEVADRRTDNPDQRIAEDLRLFTSNTLDLALGLLGSAVTLVSFVGILWVISGPLAFAVGPLNLEIPGYMVWVALLYALVGSGLTHLVGRPLIPLSFQQQRLEADFRFNLVRLRENAEGVALYGGEAVERENLTERFERVRVNWWQLMRFTKNLTFLTVGYAQIADIFPILVAAPRYFQGIISLGVLSQIGNAFGQVQGSLSWFVDNYPSLATWKATVDRLLTFQEAMDVATAQAAEAPGIRVSRDGAGEVRAEHLSLALPSGRVIVSNADLAVGPGQRVLISGPTGSGKSTLFRALAGIWPFGTGKVEVPERARILFLPQRAYMPIASLREAVTYPAPAGTFDDATVVEALQATGLGALANRLDEVQNWSLQLSGGELQRLAIARAILHRPDWLFLDEATAALDEAAEAQLYTLLRERLPAAAIVSIAHRPRVGDFHQTRFSLASDGTRSVLQPVIAGDGRTGAELTV
jgi:putative ATP-binding cassette transporter